LIDDKPDGMKGQFFLIIVVINSFGLRAQNLVPNGDFEDTLYCPQTLSHMQAATGWREFRATPDFFHSCSPSTAFPSADVPDNRLGYQYARSGESYGGFYSFQIPGPGKEFMGIQLTQPLAAGEKYFVTFYVSMAVNYGLGVGMATNKLGVRFSTVSYTIANPMPADGVAPIYTDSIVADSVNWYKISGSFIADSNYTYLAIGNFFPDSTIALEGDSIASRAYYYVDDVCVSSDSITCNETITGEDVHDKLTVRIVPNPATTAFTISDLRSTISKIEMYNVMGEKVFSQPVTSNAKQVTINVVDFSPGVYFVKVINEQGSITRKVVIQH
jgi:hypothetical protein